MRNYRKTFLRVILSTLILFLSANSTFVNATKSTDSNRGSLIVQQTKRIQGSVKDKLGETLVGASVVEKGTTNGTMTDTDGRFNMDVKEGATLVFSYLGHITQEINVGSKNNYDVILDDDSKLIEEIVVIGYGTMKKQNLTGSVASVNFDEKMESRPTVNLSSALTGLSPGLRISQSNATPGAEGVGIQIRGQGSLSMSTEPLVLIDGVAGGLNDVNPNDVESISVLKDAASSAIYGSRAANGVILVTTKKGDAQKITISYTGHVGWQSAAKTVDFISDYATHMELMNEASINTSAKTVLFAPEKIEEWRTKSLTNPLYPNTDWYKEMLNTAITTEHNLSVRGGNKSTKFLLSLGYLDNKGVIDNSGYKRYSFRLNVDTEATKWLKMGANVFGSWGDRAPIDSDNFFLLMRSTNPGIIPQHEDGRYGGSMMYKELKANNPRAYIDHLQGNYERQKMGVKFYGIVKLHKYLEWESSFGANYDNRRNWEFRDTYSLWNFQENTQWTPNANRNSGLNTSRRDYSTILNTLLRFNYSINKEHSFNVLAGFDQQYNRMDNLQATKYSLISDKVHVLDTATADPSVGGTATDDALRSFFGRVNYDFRGKYLFEANMRYDGSSRFQKNNRWGVFPAFSAGWRLTSESLLQPLKVVFDDVKLRGSWGKLGNNRIGDYRYQSTYASQNYSFGGLNGSIVPGIALKELSNRNIKWEATTLTNIGLDMTLLNNSLSLSVEYYNKTTDDALARLPVPGVLGNVDSPWQNLAKIQNKGIEAQATYYGKIRNEFQYSIGGNISTVNNKVVRYQGENVKSINGAYVITEGSAYNSFYLLEVDRIAQSQEEIDKMIADGYIFTAAVGGTPKAGDFIYRDANGDKRIDMEDRVIKGSSIPKFSYGIHLTASYKGFDFYALGQGVGDANAYWGQDGFNSFDLNQSFLIREEVLKRWTPENPTTKYPRATMGSSINTMKSDYWLQSVSYFRIKSLQLGYTLPHSLSTKLSVSKLRFYTSLEDYFTFTNFDGFNPENANMSYPSMKQWVVGLNLTF